jgi:hypothetical protein
VLSGLREMPKLESSLQLDFASLLGPLFYTWVVLLPISTLTGQVPPAGTEVCSAEKSGIEDGHPLSLRRSCMKRRRSSG